MKQDSKTNLKDTLNMFQGVNTHQKLMKRIWNNTIESTVLIQSNKFNNNFHMKMNNMVEAAEILLFNQDHGQFLTITLLNNSPRRNMSNLSIQSGTYQQKQGKN